MDHLGRLAERRKVKQIKMAGSSSSNHGYPYPYPYPSHVCAPNFVTVKLNGRNMYNVWKTQMLCLLESHDMLAFITAAKTMSVLGKEKDGDYLLWRRSDALVKGWILGSLSQQTLNHVISNTDFTVKDLWDKLRTSYGLLLQHQPTKADYDPDIEERSKREYETINEEEKKLRKDEQEVGKDELHEAILQGDLCWVITVLSSKVVTMRDKIIINGNTTLHVAMGTRKDTEFLHSMLKLARQSDQPLDMKNSEESTPLHVVAIVGNTEAAKMLVEANRDLLLAEDNEGQTPVAKALSNMHTDTYLFLWDHYIKFGDVEKHDMFDSGDLMVNMISSKNYHSACKLFEYNKLSPRIIGTVLMAIAQNFPPKLTFWENVINSGDVQTKLKFVKATQRKEEAYSFAKILLDSICRFIKNETEFRLHHDYYNNAILEATRQNAYKVVKIIVFRFRDVIWSTNEDGHNIIQYAVINR